MRVKCLRLRAQGRGRGILLRADEAAVVIEFAVVTPLLLTLLLGIFWVGRGYNVYETITRAAREGARYAVLPSSMHDGNTLPDSLSNTCISTPTSSNVFNDYIAPALSASSLDPIQVQNFCQKTNWLGNTGDDLDQCGVEISFTYPVQMVIPFTSINYSTINIQTHVQMRLENQPVVSGGTPTCP
jgi:Flp pilus assembly protein TadG